MRPPPLPRRSVRLRLTLVYGGLFLLSGAGLLAITYFLVSHQGPQPGNDLLLHGRPLRVVTDREGHEPVS